MSTQSNSPLIESFQMSGNSFSSPVDRCVSPGLNSGCVKIVAVETYADFRGLREIWSDLHSSSSYPSIFATWEWADAWWRHFKEHRRFAATKTSLCIVTVQDGLGQTIGIAPLYFEQSMNRPFGVRRLRLLGDGGGGEYLTEEPVLLLKQSQEQKALSAILSHVTSPAMSEQWDALYFYEIGDFHASPIRVDTLSPVMKRRIWETKTWDGPEVVDLPETWPLYRSALSRSMKDNLPYYPRKLSKRNPSWSVHEVRDPQDMLDATDHLIRLHNLRANSNRGIVHKNHLHGAKQGSFLREIMPALAAQKRAFIALLEVDGHVVGAQALLECAGCMTIYYSGYDPEYYEYSPITIIEAAVIERSFERGVKRLNFLPYPAHWKERWGAKPYKSVQYLSCSSQAPFGVARALARKVYNKLPRL